jgi:hypothetical protein
MAVKGNFVFINYKVVAINFYYLVIVWNKESKDLLVKFFFALYKFKELNNTPYR